MLDKIKYIILFLIILILVLLTACERNKVAEPSPTGPATTAKVLFLSANPNTIFAGNTRQTSTITAILKEYDGTPLVKKKLYFEVTDEFGLRVNIGWFGGKKTVVKKITDNNGVARVKYYGPTANEVNRHIQIYIWVSVAGKGEEFIWEKTPILIIPKHL
ncbi:MAG: hypothetical protein ACE5WD_04355 [Candidatus Aminicenantia bacterium]